MIHIFLDGSRSIESYGAKGDHFVQVIDHKSTVFGSRQLRRLKDQIMTPDVLEVGNHYWRWDVQDPNHRRYWHFAGFSRVQEERGMEIVDSLRGVVMRLDERLSDVGISPYEDTGFWNIRYFLTPIRNVPKNVHLDNSLNVGFSPRWIY